MAELLICLRSKTHLEGVDDDKDRRSCMKRGMPIAVHEDGAPWGRKEGLPDHFILKVPEVPVEAVTKYLQPEVDYSGVAEDGVTPARRTFRYRLWRLRVDSMPEAAKNIVRDTGQLTIKAGAYSGPYDYTWQQVKNFLQRQDIYQTETDDL